MASLNSRILGTMALCLTMSGCILSLAQDPLIDGGQASGPAKESYYKGSFFIAMESKVDFIRTITEEIDQNGNPVEAWGASTETINSATVFGAMGKLYGEKWEFDKAADDPPGVFYRGRAALWPYLPPNDDDPQNPNPPNEDDEEPQPKPAILRSTGYPSEDDENEDEESGYSNSYLTYLWGIKSNIADELTGNDELPAEIDLANWANLSCNHQRHDPNLGILSTAGRTFQLHDFEQERANNIELIRWALLPPIKMVASRHADLLPWPLGSGKDKKGGMIIRSNKGINVFPTIWYDCCVDDPGPFSAKLYAVDRHGEEFLLLTKPLKKDHKGMFFKGMELEKEFFWDNLGEKYLCRIKFFDHTGQQIKEEDLLIRSNNGRDYAYDH